MLQNTSARRSSEVLFPDVFLLLLTPLSDACIPDLSARRASGVLSPDVLLLTPLSDACIPDLSVLLGGHQDELFFGSFLEERLRSS